MTARPASARARARYDARHMSRDEGDRIAAAVLQLTATLASTTPLAPPPVGAYPEITMTEESRWLDSLDAETRAGWPG